MFNFFRKPPSFNSDNDIINFQRSFDNRQRAAIISTLIIVANCDGRINSKEEAAIENIVSLLGASLNDPLLKQLPSLGRQHLISILNTLTKTQKEWLLIAVYELAHSDGKVAPIETSYSASIAKDIGFSENQYLLLIDKAVKLRSTIPVRKEETNTKRSYDTANKVRTDGYYLLKGEDYIYVYALLPSGKVAWFSEFVVGSSVAERILLAKTIYETINNPKVWATQTAVRGTEIISTFTINGQKKSVLGKLKGNGQLQVFLGYVDSNGEKVTEWYDYDFVKYGSY